MKSELSFDINTNSIPLNININNDRDTFSQTESPAYPIATDLLAEIDTSDSLSLCPMSSDGLVSSFTNVSSSMFQKPISFAKKISSNTAKSITNRLSRMKRRYTVICSSLAQSEYNSLANVPKSNRNSNSFVNDRDHKDSLTYGHQNEAFFLDSDAETPVGTSHPIRIPKYNGSTDTLCIKSQLCDIELSENRSSSPRSFDLVNYINFPETKNFDQASLPTSPASNHQVLSISSITSQQSIYESRGIGSESSEGRLDSLDSIFSELDINSKDQSSFAENNSPSCSKSPKPSISQYKKVSIGKSFDTISWNKHRSLPTQSSQINLDENSHFRSNFTQKSSDFSKSTSCPFGSLGKTPALSSQTCKFVSYNSFKLEIIDPSLANSMESKLVKMEIVGNPKQHNGSDLNSFDLKVETLYTFKHEHLLYIKALSITFSQAMEAFFGTESLERNVEKSISLLKGLFGDLNCFAVQQGITILGFCYEFGIGVECDYAKSEKLYTLPAQRGNALAQSRLVFLKKYGRPGVCIDRIKAEDWANKIKANKNMESLDWLLKASNEYHFSEAQYALGLCYHDGIGAEVDEKRAFELYLLSAKQGNARGQGILGYCYGEGFGVKQNKIEAVKWYVLAANQGESVAMYNLGYCYEDGIGVPRNPILAVQWYRKAAERGNAFAQNSLGYCHEDGLGVKKNPKQAVKWYRLSALQGYPWAECNLGYCYQYGIGVQVNPAMATYWYQRAAYQGHARAQHNLGYCYQNGIYVDKNEEEAVKWYQKAAKQGNIYAYHSLGYCYQNGAGVPVNFEEAARWYKKAADKNHPPAQLSLGYCYRNGIGLEKDDNLAFKWFEASAKSGNALAQNSLGYCYEEGIGTEQNLKLAFYYYTSSAAQNNPWAICNVGYCYSQGIGVAQNLQKAVYLYRVAAKMDHARAMEKLGLALLEGVGTARNEQEALMWFKKAATTLYHAPAMHWLGVCYERGLGTEVDESEAIYWYQLAISHGDSSAVERLRSLLIKRYKVSKIIDVSSLVVFDLAAPAA
ncbi:hypothetical protein AYI68_g3102 [Smittium mucronatum]|uniref:HCP-like protein n=1 Tax=Smittium mucronatum TaxID=133383 RepID=A0A1R0H0T0_9FUNG|nr:hypothetical protein AYI68_g3102 [Smittium mucronatum]